MTERTPGPGNTVKRRPKWTRDNGTR